MHCLELLGFPKKDHSHLQTQRSLCQPARNMEEPRKTRKERKKEKKSTFPLSALSVLAQICSWFVEFALNQHLLPAQLMPSCAGNGTPRSCAALTAPQGQVLEGLNLFDT